MNILSVLLPAFGYMLVALLSCIAGYSVSSGFNGFYNVSYGHYSLLVFYMLLAFPLYVNRAMLYEQDVGNADGDNVHERLYQVLKYNIKFNFFVLLFLFAFVFFLVQKYTFLFDVDVYDRNIVFFKMILLILPVAVIEGGNSVFWLRGKEDVYTFRYRSLFPALYTCVIPFVYGWSEINNYMGLLFVDALLLAIWLISLKLKLSGLVRFFVVILFLILLMFFITRITFLFDERFVEFVQVFTFGVLMTLVMGITESWRISTRVRDGMEFNPREYYDDDDLKALYVSGANFVTALFLPLFFLIFISPSVNHIFIVLSITILLFQYLVWFIFSKKLGMRFWGWFGLVFGFMMPILISLGSNMDGEIVQKYDEIVLFNAIALIVGSAAFTIPYTVFIYSRKISFTDLERKFYLRDFLTVDSCIAMTGFASGVLSFFVAILSVAIYLFEQYIPESGFLFQRILIVYCVYIIIVVVCFAALMAKTKFNAGSKKKKLLPPVKNKPAELMSMILISGRPATSLLVGFCSFLIVYMNTTYGIASIIRISPIILVTMMGFIVNDVLDLEKDKYAKKNRYITRGDLSLFSAVLSAFILLNIALLIDFLYGSLVSYWLLSITAVGVIVYSPFSHNMPLFKGLWTALLSCAPIYYAQAISGVSIPVYIYILLIVFIVGRELLMDVKDRLGDLSYGMKTIPYYIGERVSISVAWFAMVSANVLFVLFMSDIVSVIFSISSILFLFISFVLGRKDQELVFVYSKISLLFLSVSVAFNI